MSERGLILNLPLNGNLVYSGAGNGSAAIHDSVSFVENSMYSNYSGVVVVPHRGEYLLGDFTASARLKLIDTGQYGRVLDKLYNAGFAIMLTTGHIECDINGLETHCPNNLPTNQWVHIALTRKGGVASVYIDGLLQVENGTVGAAALSSTSDLAVAGKSASTDSRISGYVKDVRVYNYAMTASQIARLANRLSKDKSNV